MASRAIQIRFAVDSFPMLSAVGAAQRAMDVVSLQIAAAQFELWRLQRGGSA